MTLIEKITKTLLEENEKRYIEALKISLPSIADPTEEDVLYSSLNISMSHTLNKALKAALTPTLRTALVAALYPEIITFIEKIKEVSLEENRKRYNEVMNKHQEVKAKLLTDWRNTIIVEQEKESVN